MADKPAIILDYEGLGFYTDRKFQRRSTVEEARENLASGDDNVEKTEKTDDEEITESKETTNAESVVVTEEAKVISEPKLPTLAELADSDYIRNRQLASRSIIESLHQAGPDREALLSVVSIMCKLSEDSEVLVRQELIEHIPSIALFCEEHAEILGAVTRQQIVPFTVKTIGDYGYGIRKSAHSSLLALVENKFIDQSQLSEWICPLIVQFILNRDPQSPEEVRIEDVSVMCRMIPIIGKDMAKTFFLEPFISVCGDRSIYIRKVVAQHFGEICLVMGAEITESLLLPAFLNLCSDDLWNVRKECADAFSIVSRLVSPKTRHDVLPHIFINLLNDESRSVWLSAYQSFGGFIATFADPWKSILQYSNGVWFVPAEEEQYSIKEEPLNTPNENDFELLTSQILLNPQFLDEFSFKNLNSSPLTDNCSFTCETFKPISLCEYRLKNTDNFRYKNYNKFEPTESEPNYETASSEHLSDENFNVNSEMSDVENSVNFEKKLSAKDGHVYLHVNNENLFNNFQFWRTPLPEIELDIDIEECKSANISVRAKMHSEDDSSKACASELNVTISSEKAPRDNFQRSIPKLSFTSSQDTEHSLVKNVFFAKRGTMIKNAVERIYADRLNTTEFEEKNKKTEMTVFDQDVVPPELLEKYISSARELPTSEEEKNISCAYNFPSVAYTLGSKNWPCLRNLFVMLCTDLKYTVRKTIASSLHELAVILGYEIAKEDLLPVFFDLLKDVEAVRTKVLQHVSEFLKQLKIQDRRQFLPLIKDICMWKNASNWRFRFTIVEQLIPCVDLYSSSEALYFFPVPLSFMQDKVSAVRRSAVELLAVIIKSMGSNPRSFDFIKAVLVALDNKYRKANKWLWRQLYVFLCEELAVKRSLPTEFYVNEIIPNLLSLAWDTVANVRLAVARCLGLSLLPLDFLPSIQRAHYQLLLQVMFSLQSDVDRDVRHFAHLSAASFNVLPPQKLSPV